MAQEQRKAKAVLDAAIAWEESLKAGVLDDMAVKRETLRAAVAKYKELKAALANLSPADAAVKFICPHCGAEDPGYGWHYNAGDTGPFAVCYLTCFCGECKRIISTSVTTFIPSKQLAEGLMAQFAALIGKKPS